MTFTIDKLEYNWNLVSDRMDRFNAAFYCIHCTEPEKSFSGLRKRLFADKMTVIARMFSSLLQILNKFCSLEALIFAETLIFRKERRSCRMRLH